MATDFSLDEFQSTFHWILIKVQNFDTLVMVLGKRTKQFFVEMFLILFEVLRSFLLHYAVHFKIYECVLQFLLQLYTVFYYLYFLRISKLWSMLHHGSAGRVQSKHCNSLFTYRFLAYFFCYFSSRNLFLSFSFLFLMKYQISTTEYQPIRNRSW